MSREKPGDIAIECPCCGARLIVDARLGKIISHEAAAPKRSAVDLEQAARREAIFKQSAEEIKIQSQILERKFEVALEKSKDKPMTRPTRDIDLD